jgi:hypothetical protein
MTANVAGARRAMFTPTLDALLVGGASLVVLPMLVALATRPWKGNDHGALFVGGILLNWPHFMASYGVLYGQRDARRQHPLATLWVPAALALYCVTALALPSPLMGNALIVVGGLYLARHYTGQAWGMMASYAFVGGVRFEDGERRLVRLGLDLAMGWHLVWAAQQSIGLVSAAAVPAVQTAYARAWLLLAAGFVLSAAGVGLCARRLGRLPPARVLLPWLALFAWYVAMAIEPTALYVAQLAHAAQYLVFPARVEVNRAGRSPRAALAWWALWTVVGLAVFEGFEPLFGLGLGLTAGGADAGLARNATGVVISAIAIHHYVIDGVLYKLRNPEVRRSLFSHLEER